MAERDETSLEFTGVPTRATENQELIQHKSGISYEACMTHMSTPDSSIEKKQHGNSQHISPPESLDTEIQQHSGDFNGDQDMTGEDEILLSQATSCSSISTVSCFDEPENQVSIQHKPCTSYNPPFSESSSEEWRKVDLSLKANKNKSKQKSWCCSSVSSFTNHEKQVSILHEPGVPDKASVTLRPQSSSDSVPLVSFHFRKLDLLYINIAL